MLTNLNYLPPDEHEDDIIANFCPKGKQLKKSLVPDKKQHSSRQQTLILPLNSRMAGRKVAILVSYNEQDKSSCLIM